MITVYRISKRKHASNPLGGLGGLHVGGRWHHKGAPIVYCAETFSLANVEFFVHFGKRQRAIKLISFDIAIPEALVQRLPTSRLPADWAAEPSSSSTADLGADWLKSSSSAVLVVPSVHSRSESNYLINPLHPQASKIKVQATYPHKYDSRMWK